MINQKEGTLVLIKQKRHPKLGEIVELGSKIFIAHEKVVTRGQRDYVIITPMIVCDDEIKDNNLTYHAQEPGVYYPKNGGLSGDKKVLVDTPQIPDHVIEAIVNGNLKDGDKVLVECDNESGKANLSIGLMGKNSKCVVTIPEKNTSPILYTEEEVVNLIYEQYKYTRSLKTLNNVLKKEINDWFEQHKKK